MPDFASVPALFMQVCEIMATSIQPSQPIVLGETGYSIPPDSSLPFQICLKEGVKLIHAYDTFHSNGANRKAPSFLVTRPALVADI